VIIGYADEATRDVHTGVESRVARRFGADVRAVARRKLDLIGAAADIRDLAVPPGNRLEKLKGRLAGFHSIRVTTSSASSSSSRRARPRTSRSSTTTEEEPC